MTLLIASRFADIYRRLIESSCPDLSIVWATSVDEGIRLGRNADIVLGEPSLLKDILPAMTSPRWVQSTWAGVEPLVAPGMRRDYALTNARGVFGALMSEYVFAYLLAHERRILQRYATQQEAKWDQTPAGSLRGRQIGLLGVGSIGAAIAGTAKHFGMRVKGLTRSSADCPDVDAYYHDDRLGFAADLDYVVAVLPNTPATRHIVDAELLTALPERAVFVNPGRGNVVDEAALIEALERHRIAGAVLDVFEQEPLPPSHPLWRMPNVLITSHTAAFSHPPEIAPLFVENLQRFVQGEPLRYQVDFERGY